MTSTSSNYFHMTKTYDNSLYNGILHFYCARGDLFNQPQNSIRYFGSPCKYKFGGSILHGEFSMMFSFVFINTKQLLASMNNFVHFQKNKDKEKKKERKARLTTTYFVQPCYSKHNDLFGYSSATTAVVRSTMIHFPSTSFCSIAIRYHVKLSCVWLMISWVGCQHWMIRPDVKAIKAFCRAKTGNIRV